MPVRPLARRANSPTRGRHLLASERIEKGNLIFCERPMVALQSTGNVHEGVLVCHYCMAFCGSPGQALRVAADPTELEGIVTSDPSPDQHDGDHALIPCRHRCGQVYCSLECQEDDWKWGGHKELCTGCIEDLEHPLVQFRIHAVHSNEIFLLIAKWLALIHNQKVPYNDDDTAPNLHPLIDFSMNLWWDITKLSFADSPTDSAEMVALDRSCRTLCDESHAFLEAAWPEHKDSKWLTPSGIARLIGSMEQNCIGVRRKHALRQNIMEDKELRLEYHHQIVKCLDKSGMIGEDHSMCHDESCETDAKSEVSESTGSENMDLEGPLESDPDAKLDDDERSYSPDDIAEFLSNLSHPLNIGSDDDWDEIFPPLDGTAHFAFTEKMNHSCEPNSVVLYRSRGWGRNHPLVAYCVAVKDIQADEELTIAYIQTDESYESRQKALVNYGFECSCPRCVREKSTLPGPQDTSSSIGEERQDADLDQDGLFGIGDNDEDSDTDESIDAVSVSESKRMDGDTKLKSAVEKIESIWNKSTHATIPPRYLAVASGFVTQMVASLNENPGALRDEVDETTLKLLQQCRNGVCEWDFSLCRIVGPGLEHHLYCTLEARGRFESPQFRAAYWCACCTAALGLAQEGSFLLALQNLDKALVLGLKRSSVDDFMSYVELFASQMSATPCPHAIECIIPDFNDMESLAELQTLGPSAPISFPVSEISCSPSHFGKIVKEQSEPMVLRRFAENWPALSKWRNMETFSHSYGHRMVPVEVGSMRSGMKEQLMSIRGFISKYMTESTTKTFWSLDDSTDPCSNIAYLAQHPLLEQIPELWEDVERNPCGVEPSNVNTWIGTGGTRTPLHFDSYDNLLIQLVGCKYIRLYHPKETPNLYVSCDKGYGLQGNMSELDCETEDYHLHPLAKDAAFTEVLLLPGDCLYIPSRHWHYVRSLSTSASINYWF